MNTYFKERFLTFVPLSGFVFEVCIGTSTFFASPMSYEIDLQEMVIRIDADLIVLQCAMVSFDLQILRCYETGSDSELPTHAIIEAYEKDKNHTDFLVRFCQVDKFFVAHVRIDKDVA